MTQAKQRFGAFDAVATACIFIEIVGTWLGWWVVVLRGFAPMLKEFGSQGNLPWLTRYSLSPAFPLSATAIWVAAILFRLVGPRKAGRIAMLLSLSLVALVLVVAVVAMYQPVSSLAGSVKAN